LSYLRDLTIDEQREVIEESLSIDSSALDSAPRFLQESLIFPYVQGQRFMERLFALEGQAGIDAAYLDPPMSTEQVITPEDFGRDQPVAVELPPIDLDGYELEYESVWGELSFEIMFNQVLGSRSDASEGWGGDRYRVYFDGTEVVLVLAYVGDTESDAVEMEDALLDYLEETLDAARDGQTFQGADYGHVSRSSDSLIFVAATDPAAGAVVVESLSGA
jgi:hypothetical protein